MYDTLGDADIVDQYKHIFQNRPINNQLNNNSKPAQPRDDNDNDHRRYLANTITTTTTYDTKDTQQYSHQQPVSSRQQNEHPTTYTEREQQLAVEQLRVVRRTLRDCSPNSSYFRKYAALADDWRNFLPGAVRDHNNTFRRHHQSQHQRYRSNRNEFSDGSEELHYARDMYDDHEYSDDESDESGPGCRVVSCKPPLVKKDTYTRTMPSTSTSMPSFVKELLREEELAMLVSSTHFNSHHNLAAVASDSREDIGGEELSRNESMSSTLSSSMSSDDTEANDADADESYGPPGGRARVTTRRNRVAKTNGPRTRYARPHQRASNKTSPTTGIADLPKTSYQCQSHRSQGHHELKKIGPADRSPAGRRRSPRRTANQYRQHHHHNHQQHTQLQPAHFGRIHLEDIVRSIESEFTLALDHSEGSDDEDSENSLTCLVSGYENSGIEDDEEDLISSVRRLHQATTTQRETSTSGVAPATSSIAESTSPQSTLLNSSDARSEASVDPPSPSGVLATEASTLQLEQSPKYVYLKEDHPVIAPPCQNSSTSSSSTSALVEAAVVALAKTREAIKEENAKANSDAARPALKLQTHIMVGIAPGALSAFESRPLGSQYSLTKCNSTSSLYIDSTMLKSDVDETLRA